jgi:transcriptional regulator with XRE-family HTH domain
MKLASSPRELDLATIGLLIEERRRRGWSLRWVADLAGFSTATLMRYERGSNVPDMYALADWADVFGYDLLVGLRERAS